MSHHFSRSTPLPSKRTGHCFNRALQPSLRLTKTPRPVQTSRAKSPTCLVHCFSFWTRPPQRLIKTWSCSCSRLTTIDRQSKKGSWLWQHGCVGSHLQAHQDSTEDFFLSHVASLVKCFSLSMIPGSGCACCCTFLHSFVMQLLVQAK